MNPKRLEATIHLTYVDDNHINCAIAISHLRDDSEESIPEEKRHQNFAACIIRNIQGLPKDREVLYIAHPSLLAEIDVNTTRYNQRLREKNVFKKVLAFTHSAHLNQLLKKLVSPQGHLSLPEFDELAI